MKTATKHFYLAFFALFESCQSRATGTAPSYASRADVCAIEPTAIVSDACASYATLDSLNDALSRSLQDVTKDTDFFAYYRLNLYDQKCPVRAWDNDSGMCGNIACAVDTIEDEKDIPPIWRTEELSKLEGPKAAHPGKQQQQERGKERPLQGTLGENVGESCVVEYDDECDERDYCVPEDESATAKGDYVSLVENPERFTGYAGQDVWDAIYQENCFSKDMSSTPQPLGFPFQARDDLRSILQANTDSNDFPLEDECLEKRVFHRIISGMHASISTHICFDYLNQTTGTWGPNLQCYQERLASHPERISNLYFDYAILLRAVAKLRTYLRSYTFCSGDVSQDQATKAKILAIADTAAQPPPFFDEHTMFQDPDVSVALKEDFRNRFRNTVGYGTALKVLFEFDEHKNGENPPLRRTELVALVNTLDRVSHSLKALGKMRDMINPAAEPEVVLEIPEVPKQKPASRGWDRPGAQPAINLPDDDEEEYIEAGETAWEAAKDEFQLVWRTYVFVLKSWVNTPAKVFKILIMELNRAWSFWLGLPVPQRSWEIKFPTRDEL
ncbi:uncharacterized protein KY384_008567 [Bacidia gigantensis]|uniref:uncharacterized protein n=1 Tax=Bacidia gigantensis TaxID=2732470 RepID=UPI001D04468A|nr:uncharacterized protein KY384_008567 [Bacidia gigantensis]KAG8527138.1 hypothetical protein KY384_008567 [Bacidia gigantensis]